MERLPPIRGNEGLDDAEFARLWARYLSTLTEAERVRAQRIRGRQRQATHIRNEIRRGRRFYLRTCLESQAVGLGDAWEPRRRPARPTAALAGSLAKLEVLRRRAMRGEELWHVNDSQGLSDRRPGQPE